MFRFIKKMFTQLLGFGGSIATKSVYLNNEPCQVRPRLIDVNSNEPIYHPFVVSTNKLKEIVTLLMIHMLKYALKIK